MIEKLAHVIMPLAVIGAVTTMACLNVIDSTTAIIYLSAAGGYGSIAVGAAGHATKPPGQ